MKKRLIGKEKIKMRNAISFKRRTLGKTDYRKRLALLRSRKPRLVIRKSLNNIIAQVVEYKAEGDSIVAAFNSLNLKKMGWLFKRNNLPAAYLTGLMIGKKAKEKNINEAIADIGLYRSVPSSRIYAVVKGALDAGLKIPHDKKILPSEERVNGKHILDYAKLKKKDEKYTELLNKFTELKEKIRKG